MTLCQGSCQIEYQFFRGMVTRDLAMPQAEGSVYGGKRALKNLVKGEHGKVDIDMIKHYPQISQSLP